MTARRSDSERRPALRDGRRAHVQASASWQLDRFQLLVDSVRDYAIYMIDPQGQVNSWSRGAERLKGYTASEILGKHFSVFFPPEAVAAGACERELEIARREGRFEEESWRVRKDGSRFFAHAIVTAMRDASGRLLGFAKVTRDLTERRRAEEERIRLARAEAALQVRDEFLAIASHELRTPVASLRMQLESLRPRLGTLDPVIDARIRRAADSTERLAELIETLLDVSRLTTGRPSLRRGPVDLADAVRAVVDRHNAAAEQAGAEVALDLEEGLRGAWDRARIEQVVANLLENALKFGAGTRVRIRTLRSDGNALLVLADAGPGIPAELGSRLFQRFARAGSILNHPGLGLGLFLAHEIVEAHGGTIAAENLPGGGARFTVRLPLAAPG